MEGGHHVGRLVQSWCPDDSIKYSYDEFGRLVKKSKKLIGKTYITRNEFDKLGRNIKKILPDGEQLAYTYNIRDLVTSINRISCTSGRRFWDPKSYLKSVQYDDIGRVVTLVYGNDVELEMIWNNGMRENQLLNSIRARRGLFYFSQDSMRYDRKGNLIRLKTVLNDHSGSSLVDRTQHFIYDYADRLLDARSEDVTSPSYSFSYDAIGNLIDMDTETQFYGTTISGDKILPHGVTSRTDGSILKYDNNGNLIEISKGTQKWGFKYDSEGRLLTTFKNGTETGRLVYGSDGNRLLKIVGRGTTIYASSDYQIKKQGDTCSDHKYYSTPSHIIATTSCENSAETTLYTIGDYLGSINAFLSYTGSLVGSRIYSPFGHIEFESGLVDNYLSVHGGENDKGLLNGDYDFVHFGLRQYLPFIGRFTTPDKAPISYFEPQMINPYTFANNNPINFVDLTGTSSTQPPSTSVSQPPLPPPSYEEIDRIEDELGIEFLPDEVTPGGTPIFSHRDKPESESVNTPKSDRTLPPIQVFERHKYPIIGIVSSKSLGYLVNRPTLYWDLMPKYGKNRFAPLTKEQMKFYSRRMRRYRKAPKALGVAGGGITNVQGYTQLFRGDFAGAIESLQGNLDIGPVPVGSLFPIAWELSTGEPLDYEIVTEFYGLQAAEIGGDFTYNTFLKSDSWWETGGRELTITLCPSIGVALDLLLRTF